jgi:iron(III) transport system substrate-binding protein
MGAVKKRSATCYQRNSRTSPQSSTAPKKGGSLQAIIAAANQEGMVNWADNGKAELIVELGKAFNAHFGTNIVVQQAPLAARAANTRVRQEVAAGRVSLDVMHPSSGIIAGMRNDNVDVLRDPIDWIGLFGDSLPGLKSVVERVPSAWRGQVLEYQHLAEVIVYNTKHVSEAEAPRSWEDLLKPKWKGRRLAVDPRGSSTYKMFIKWGEEKSLEYARKLTAQDPLWIPQSPAIARAVARGDAAVGITSAGRALEHMQAGAPIKVAKVDFSPTVATLVTPIKGSPNPNAAILWAAWVSTEGVRLMRKLGDPNDRVWPELDDGAAKLLRDLGIEVVMILEPKDLLKADQQQAAVGDIIERAGVGKKRDKR